MFALALRDASKWDNSPLVDVSVFLAAPGGESLSEALREMTHTAETEEYDGKRQDWGAILLGELKKAQASQDEHKALEFREVEQAVVATFLHSQPIGKKASTRELLLMLGDTNPDRIELTKALRQWAKSSWFLDEAEMGEEFLTGSVAELPKNWQLGCRPNLKQIHHAAVQRITDAQVNFELKEAIEKRTPKLTSGASAAGAKPHLAPNDPSDVSDDEDFHYVVLGTKAVSEPGKPSAEARRFIEETTSPDRPRVHRNAILIAVPSRDGLEAARQAIRENLGWREVESLIADQKIEESRRITLKKNLEDTASRIPLMVLQAYTIVVTVDKDGEIKAMKIAHSGNQPLFDVIKADKKCRIQEQDVPAEALLPGGTHELWREGDTSRRVKDLVGAFSEFPHLPKMLKARDIRDTLAQGVERGFFVLKMSRPDKSVRTFWFERPSDETMKDASLELVLPQFAELTTVPYDLLLPSKLVELWTVDCLAVAQVIQFFSGLHSIEVFH